MNSTFEILDQTIDLTNKKEIAQYLHQEMLTFLSKLDSIWDEIGIDLDERKQRGLDVIDHVKTLFTDMLKEAEDKKSDLIATITSLLKEFSELGQDLQINISTDITGYERMELLTVKNNLKEKIKKYQEIRDERLNELRELQSREKKLCQIFGRKQQILPISPLPNLESIKEFKNYLHNLSTEKCKREEFIRETKGKINDLMSDLKITASLDFEKKVLSEDDSTFLLSDDNMNQLELFHTKLEQQKQEIQTKITDLLEKVNTLWERLDESSEARSSFLKRYPEYNINTYIALKEEEFRCKEKMKANVKTFIDKMRQDIEKLWVQSWYSNNQKKEFIHFDSDCYTEDLLTLHELYIDQLKNNLEKNKDIYDQISKRNELWTRLLELESRAINPDRFKNRGGQLLREEKERNFVKIQLPKVEQQLLTLVEKYEQEHAKTFLILGDKISNIIENDWEQFKENRHLKVSAKKEEVLTKTPKKSPGVSRMLAYASNVKTPKTPKSATKLNFRLFGQASTKKNKSFSKKPKIQVNGSTINKRASLERRKRFERKRRSQVKASVKSPNITSDYENFEQIGMQNKEACRSTISMEEKKEENKNKAELTDVLPRTPSRTNMRSKSPNYLTPRMASATGQLPIII